MNTSMLAPPSSSRPPQEANRRPCGLLDRIARGLLFRVLDRLDEGSLTLVEGSWRRRFGGGHSGGESLTVEVHDARFYRRLILGGSIAAGETYREGWWSCDDLTGLIRLVCRRPDVFDGIDGFWSGLAKWGHRLGHHRRRNTRPGSRSNIGAHYDLGNEFYRLFLDETLMYSGAYFERPDLTLGEASTAKNDLLCRKIALGPADHLLEIGTGWGGFALHAAAHYGCRVTTTTISAKQYEAARQRIEAAGLADRVTVLQQDYRDLRGRFDKIVSIEMVEAVGHEFLGDYFRRCAELMRPGGVMGLQSIILADRNYEAYLRRADFIQRYIFPGGSLPSVGWLRKASEGAGLEMRHLEDLTQHYCRTLVEWRRRFLERRHDVLALGFDEAFVRMWEYYLCYCEGGFAEGNIGLVQMVFEKPR